MSRRFDYDYMQRPRLTDIMPVKPMQAPRKLAVSPLSPHYDKDAIKWVDRVFCDGEWFPDVVAYDMDAGWLVNKVNGVWAPRKYGVITVKLKDIVLK